MSVLQRMLEEFASLGAGVGAARQAAARSLHSRGLPGRAEENWRHANLRALDRIGSFLPPGVSATAMPEPVPAASALDAADLPAPLPGFLRLVLVDGHVRGDLGSAPGTLPGLAVGGAEQRPTAVAETAVAEAPALAAPSDERLGLIATLFAPTALRLRVSEPLSLEIISLTTPTTGANYLDLALSVDPGVSCHLIERHLGGGVAEGFACVRLDLALGTSATLVHQRLLAVDQQMMLLDNLHARLEERADYRLRQITVGGGTSRSTAEVQLQGRDAALDWQALAAGSGRQVNDTMLTVLHQAAGTRSEQLFRAIASEQAHIACNADTQVSAQARGAKVRQSLRGLVDGVGAEVDLRPQLTINTDDIEARHGATTGRLDDDLLFYLLSRGLRPDEARALLHWAFLGEVLKSVEPAALRRDAQRLAAARLRAAPAPELLQ